VGFLENKWLTVAPDLNCKRGPRPDQTLSILREHTEQVVSNVLLARNGSGEGNRIEAKLYKEFGPISEPK
jgi:hypothetical protein